MNHSHHRRGELATVISIISLATLALGLYIGFKNIGSLSPFKRANQAQETQNPDGTCPYVTRVAVYKDRISPETLIPASEFAGVPWGVSNQNQSQDKPAGDFLIWGGGFARYDYVTG